MSVRPAAVAAAFCLFESWMCLIVVPLRAGSAVVRLLKPSPTRTTILVANNMTALNNDRYENCLSRKRLKQGRLELLQRKCEFEVCC